MLTKKETRKRIYLDALNEYGVEEQVATLQELATVLALSCRKVVKSPSERSVMDLANSIADVEILIDQMKLLETLEEKEGIRKMVAYSKRAKIKKLKERVELTKQQKRYA